MTTDKMEAAILAVYEQRVLLISGLLSMMDYGDFTTGCEALTDLMEIGADLHEDKLERMRAEHEQA